MYIVVESGGRLFYLGIHLCTEGNDEMYPQLISPDQIHNTEDVCVEWRRRHSSDFSGLFGLTMTTPSKCIYGLMVTPHRKIVLLKQRSDYFFPVWGQAEDRLFHSWLNHRRRPGDDTHCTLYVAVDEDVFGAGKNAVVMSADTDNALSVYFHEFPLACSCLK